MGSMFKINGSVFEGIVKTFLLLISEELYEDMLLAQRRRNMMRNFSKTLRDCLPDP